MDIFYSYKKEAVNGVPGGRAFHRRPRKNFKIVKKPLKRPELK